MTALLVLEPESRLSLTHLATKLNRAGLERSDLWALPSLKMLVFHDPRNNARLCGQNKSLTNWQNTEYENLESL